MGNRLVAANGTAKEGMHSSRESTHIFMIDFCMHHGTRLQNEGPGVGESSTHQASRQHHRDPRSTMAKTAASTAKGTKRSSAVAKALAATAKAKKGFCPDTTQGNVKAALVTLKKLAGAGYDAASAQKKAKNTGGCSVMSIQSLAVCKLGSRYVRVQGFRIGCGCASPVKLVSVMTQTTKGKARCKMEPRTAPTSSIKVGTIKTLTAAWALKCARLRTSLAPFNSSSSTQRRPSDLETKSLKQLQRATVTNTNRGCRAVVHASIKACKVPPISVYLPSSAQKRRNEIPKSSSQKASRRYFKIGCGCATWKNTPLIKLEFNGAVTWMKNQLKRTQRRCAKSFAGLMYKVRSAATTKVSWPSRGITGVRDLEGVLRNFKAISANIKLLCNADGSVTKVGKIHEISTKEKHSKGQERKSEAELERFAKSARAAAAKRNEQRHKNARAERNAQDAATSRQKESQIKALRRMKKELDTKHRAATKKERGTKAKENTAKDKEESIEKKMERTKKQEERHRKRKVLRKELEVKTAQARSERGRKHARREKGNKLKLAIMKTRDLVEADAEKEMNERKTLQQRQHTKAKEDSLSSGSSSESTLQAFLAPYKKQLKQVETSMNQDEANLGPDSSYRDRLTI